MSCRLQKRFSYIRIKLVDYSEYLLKNQSKIEIAGFLQTSYLPLETSIGSSLPIPCNSRFQIEISSRYSMQTLGLEIGIPWMGVESARRGHRIIDALRPVTFAPLCILVQMLCD